MEIRFEDKPLETVTFTIMLRGDYSPVFYVNNYIYFGLNERKENQD